MTNIKEYYIYYLTLHKNPNCRMLHFIGQIFTIAYVVICVILSLVWGWHILIALLGTPFVVYPFAWSGHYFFEKNQPAAFRNPIKAKICDWIMFVDIIKGRLKVRK
jgi:hypothetical protein